ncbi:MAG: HD-GYP domain-containing protein [Candidatus Omnitrophica bacterium]|nr:HD-GYP domain-containing protein [Candidatus Omnitrophota bacterium]
MRIGKQLVLVKSFRAKVTIVLVLFMCLSAAITNVLIYQYVIRSQFGQLREKLMTIAQAAAMTIDVETLNEIPLNPNGVNSPAYKIIEKKIRRIKEISPNLAYIYILKRGDRLNLLKFVVDVNFENYKSKLNPAYPGQAYDGKVYPELLMAFMTPSADTKMAADKWGVFLSGYAPIFDKNGDAMAILGVDLAANDVYRMQREVKIRAGIILIFGVIFSALLSLVISDAVSSPIKRLVAGTRHVASGDLKYRVKVENPDEIGELASAFNMMSSSLYKSKSALLNYFYQIAQSLIRASEARDHYSKGHSDRVAKYSEQIARKMGLPENKIGLLKNAALLHDIGKFGIQEAILNKSSALTDEDVEIIRKHPVIGEDILKPVSLDRELLAVVREHHERYDGTGYPDKLRGSEIDMLASIVSVADSYDAMTSHRAYRKNLTKGEAIAQLKQSSGTQFDPKVVESFIEVLNSQEEE